MGHDSYSHNVITEYGTLSARVTVKNRKKKGPNTTRVVGVYFDLARVAKSVAYEPVGTTGISDDKSEENKGEPP